MEATFLNSHVMRMIGDNHLVSIVGNAKSRNALLLEVVRALAPKLGMGIYKTVVFVNKTRVFNMHDVKFYEIPSYLNATAYPELPHDKDVMLVLDGSEWCNLPVEDIVRAQCPTNKQVHTVRLLPETTEVVSDGLVIILGSDDVLPNLNDVYRQQFCEKPKGSGNVLIDDRTSCKMMFVSLCGENAASVQIPDASINSDHTAAALKTKLVASRDLGFLSGPMSLGVAARTDDFGLGWGLKAPMRSVTPTTSTAYSGKSTSLAIADHIRCECGPICSPPPPGPEKIKIMSFTEFASTYLKWFSPEGVNTIVLLGKDTGLMERSLMHSACADFYSVFCSKSVDAHTGAWFQSILYPCYVHYDCATPSNDNFLYERRQTQCILSKGWDRVFNNLSTNCVQIASSDAVPEKRSEMGRTLAIIGKDFDGALSTIKAKLFDVYLMRGKENAEFRARQDLLQENEFLVLLANGTLITISLKSTLKTSFSTSTFYLGNWEYRYWGKMISYPEQPPAGICALLQKPESGSWPEI